MKIKNRSTRIFTVVLGILTGITGLAHGIFELSIGIKPTDNILNEMGAFTILPNYLLAGIATSLICLLIIIWTIRFISTKYGAHIYLLLSIISMLTGGGIAYIPFVIFNWIVAQTINSRLSWFRKRFTKNQLEMGAKNWIFIFILSYTLLVAGILIWIFVLPPGEHYEIGTIHYLCWSILVLAFIFLILSVFAGFSRDIKTQNHDNN